MAKINPAGRKKVLGYRSIYLKFNLHKAFKMHSKVGDLRAQPQHDHPAKLVVTETAVLCARNIVTYLPLTYIRLSACVIDTGLYK